MKLKYIALLFISCVSFITQAQTFNWQELLNRKQFAKIISYSDSLSIINSGDMDAINATAQAYEGMLNYKSALKYYILCYEIDSTNLDIIGAMARISSNLGRVNDAERYFNKVIEADSTNFYANYQLARLYFNIGEYTKAIEKYSGLITDEDNSPTLYRMIGDCFIKMDSPFNAADAYYRAFETNPENGALAETLANTLYKLGPDNVEEGIAVCDTALAYNPDRCSLISTKGLGLFTNKRYQEADSVFHICFKQGIHLFLL